MSLDKTYSNLKNHGFSPKNILDIGAHKGDWTKYTKFFFPNASYFLIDGVEYPEIKNLGIPYKIEILSSQIKDVEWFQINGTGDSMFQENRPIYKNIKPIIKTCNTLDNLFPNNKFDFIKIDAQGAEIPILQGGKKLIKECEIILLELPFVGQYNKNVPDFLKHIEFMDSIGFIPFDITEYHYFNNFLIQIDILFINKNSKILQIVQNHIENA